MLCWKLPDRAQSFVFCPQIVTEKINAMFLLVSKFKMIGTERCAQSGPKKLTVAYKKGFPPFHFN